jgi:hypothetical protein
MTHSPNTLGLVVNVQTPTVGSKTRTAERKNVDENRDERREMEYARIMFETTHVVTAKLASCIKVKKARDQAMRRCPRGSVVQIRRRTRKLDMAIESQPAYVYDGISTTQEPGKSTLHAPQMQSNPCICEGYNERGDFRKDWRDLLLVRVSGG